MLKMIVLGIPIASLAACAPGGGFGLVALRDDKICQQTGTAIGTPEYEQCRIALWQQQRQQPPPPNALQTATANPPQICTYSGLNSGGIISRTSTCNALGGGGLMDSYYRGYYGAQQAPTVQQQQSSRPTTCIYSGLDTGGITSGTATCQ